MFKIIKITKILIKSVNRDILICLSKLFDKKILNQDEIFVFLRKNPKLRPQVFDILNMLPILSHINFQVKEIIENPKAGVYNLASFNDTVQSISDHIASSLEASIEETINVSGVYDFNMSTDKFEKAYDFVFAESIETIIKELADKDNHYTNRNTYVKYVCSCIE